MPLPRASIANIPTDALDRVRAICATRTNVARGERWGGGAKVGRGVKGWGNGMWAWGAVVGGRARERRVCGHGDGPTFRAFGPRCRMPLLVIPFAFAVTINQGGMVPVPPFPRAAVARCVNLERLGLQHVRGRGAATLRSEEQGEGAGQSEGLHSVLDCGRSKLGRCRRPRGIAPRRPDWERPSSDLGEMPAD